jgi:hypothetical protein
MLRDFFPKLKAEMGRRMQAGKGEEDGGAK